MEGKFSVFKDMLQENAWYVNYSASNGKIIFRMGPYATRFGARRSINSLKANIEYAPIVDFEGNELE